jgi:hypothetical protein
VREAGLFSFNALPPPERTLVRGTLIGFAGAGAEAAAGAACGARAGAVIDAVWMRCVPALFLLFMIVAATIFAMSAEVGRPPAAPGEMVSAGLPPAGCRVKSRSMPSGSGRGGAAEAAGARKSVAAVGEREGTKELKLLACKMDRLVRAGLGRLQNPRLGRSNTDSRFGPQIFFNVHVV